MLNAIVAMRAPCPLPHHTMLGQTPRAAHARGVAAGRAVDGRRFNARPARCRTVDSGYMRIRRIGASRCAECRDRCQHKQNRGWADFHSIVPVFVLRPSDVETSGAQVGDRDGVSMIATRRTWNLRRHECEIGTSRRPLHCLEMNCDGTIRRGANQDRVQRRLSRNTACSPNRFQNHHGALKRSGRPHAFSAKARSILAPATSQRSRKSLIVQK